MDDAHVHSRIEQLVTEEHVLWEREAAGSATAADRARLDEISVELDLLWDVLRQRRALSRAGKDPEAATLRDPDTVETYEQ